MLLGEHLSVAAVNGPALTVVSGLHDAVEALQTELAERGIACRLLPTSHAFHSAMVDPVVTPFRELVSRVQRNPPLIPWVSGVTGDWISPAQAVDPELLGATTAAAPYGSWTGVGKLLARFAARAARSRAWFNPEHPCKAKPRAPSRPDPAEFAARWLGGRW